jgi:hypothetical protein
LADLKDAPGPGAHIDIDANPPAVVPTAANNAENAQWATGAGDMAFITLQRQVRLVVHASDMIAVSP